MKYIVECKNTEDVKNDINVSLEYAGKTFTETIHNSVKEESFGSVRKVDIEGNILTDMQSKKLDPYFSSVEKLLSSTDPNVVIELANKEEEYIKENGLLQKPVEDRKVILLKACHELLKKAHDSNFVENVMSMTVNYDGAECDGECLLNDIAIELDLEELY